MKTKILFAAAALLTSSLSSQAIEGLTITPSGTDVVLTWPSVYGEQYIVQFRSAFGTNATWQTLTTGIVGDGSDTMSYVDPNQIPVQTLQTSARISATESSIDATVDSEQPSQPTLPPMPPLPPGMQIQGQTASGSSAMSSSTPPGPILQGGGGESIPPTYGFYRVVRNGVHVLNVASLTNAPISGIYNIAVEAGNASVTDAAQLQSATILIDGQQIPSGGTISFPQNIPFQFTFDTAYVENGIHTLCVQSSWFDPGASDIDQYPVMQSDTITISVTNTLYYPNWNPEVGEVPIASFYLKTVSPSAAWTIQITDKTNGLVKTLTGTATNGIIEYHWNMVDSHGVKRTNDVSDPVFYSTTTIQTSGQGLGAPTPHPNPPIVQRKRDFPDHGKWVVAYQDFFKWHYSENNLMYGSIVSFAQMAGSHGGAVFYYPPQGSTNDIGQTWPIRYMSTNHPDPNVTWDKVFKDHALLLSYITNSTSRNLYINSHGSANSVAGGFRSGTVKATLKHRYRFVFLDGCDTAKSDWNSAFGIYGTAALDIPYYKQTGQRPSAFCGYNRRTPFTDNRPISKNGVRYDGTIPWNIPGYISNFEIYWAQMGDGLNQALDDAAWETPPVLGWQPGEGLLVYGYQNLLIDQFNYAADMPIP